MNRKKGCKRRKRDCFMRIWERINQPVIPAIASILFAREKNENKYSKERMNALKKGIT
jgi:hypothetical protein